MGNLIPFFRYDLLARIIPGAFTISTLAYAGVEVPQPWAAILEGDPSAGAIPGSAVVVPLIYAGACYAVGVFYEVAFATWPLNLIADLITEKASARAKAHKERDADSQRADQAARYKLWSDLVHKDANKGDWFAHAHRFQAEAKMCLHSIMPALVLAIRAFVNWSAAWRSQQGWQFALAVLLFVVLCRGAYQREWRRWLQALNAKPYVEASQTGSRNQ